MKTVKMSIEAMHYFLERSGEVFELGVTDHACDPIMSTLNYTVANDVA
jgi:hypothetical protein